MQANPLYQSLLFRETIALFVIFAFFMPLSPAQAKAEIDIAHVNAIAKTLPIRAIGLGVPITDRVAWLKLAAEPAFKNWLAAAHQQLAQPLPETSDDLYLEFSRNGNRTRWQDIASARRARLNTFSLAECLEDRGEFLPALEHDIRAICAETSWLYPAHDKNLRNFHGTSVDIDLGSSRLGWEMATLDHLLGARLSKATRELIHENLQRRIFTPYRDMIEGRRGENSWMRVRNNWNAVCHAGVVGAALAALNSKNDRALFIAAAEYYLPNFHNGFGTDGYCSEGLGYWNYGFGHFIMLTETVRQATGGRTDFLVDPHAGAAALFGRRNEMINGIYPSIADCQPGSRPDSQITAYICRRMNLSPCDVRRKIFVRPTGSLFTTMLFSFLPEKLPIVGSSTSTSDSPLRTWFPDGGVMICRPATNSPIPFAVSLKGGNNHEQHNHNDVGSYIVVVGKSMLLVDPGGEVYTGRTFGSHRYESDFLNSYGHDVPVVGGKLQTTGAAARAEILNARFSDDEDDLSLNLASAYAVPTLTRLERHFTFKRGATPSLTVHDLVEFTQPESFETALVTRGTWKQITETELLFTDNGDAVRVKIDTGGIPFELKASQLTAATTTPRNVTRLGLRLKNPVAKANVTLTITPEQKK